MAERERRRPGNRDDAASESSGLQRRVTGDDRQLVALHRQEAVVGGRDDLRAVRLRDADLALARIARTGS